MNSLGEDCWRAGRLDRARLLLEESLERRKARLGSEHIDTLASMFHLAMTYRAAGQLDQALPLFEELVKLRKATLGLEHQHTIAAMGHLGEVYVAAGMPDRGLPLLEGSLKLAQASLGPEKGTTHVLKEYLAAAYDRTRNYDEAIRLFRESDAGRLRVLLAYHPTRLEGLASLGLCLLHADKPEEAESVLRECLGHRQTKQPDLWTTFDTQSLLGGALLGQKKYAEAEPLLLAGYEGMRQRGAQATATGKVRLAEALERLVQLYDATGRKDQADQWRKQLEEAKAAAKPVVRP
jgi:tetratricopeptide (TPR) repeat protein